jgi:hypothetical protein
MDAGTQIIVQCICYFFSPFQLKPKLPYNFQEFLATEYLEVASSGSGYYA